MSVLIATLLIGLQLAALAQPSSQAVLPCQHCEELTLSHYAARNCTAVFDDAVSICCPASFLCQSEEERGLKGGVCYYKGVQYAPGEDVPVVKDFPCRADCRCFEREADSSGLTVQIACASVECPSLFTPTPPNCHLLHSLDSCCEVDTICTGDLLSSVGVARTGDCFIGNQSYSIGDKMYFDDHPCQKCICSANYTGPFGPNCKAVECGMEWSDRQKLRQGCTPIYFKNGCCSIEWICPDSSRLAGNTEHVASGDETSATHCTLGSIVATRGTLLKTDNCNLNCKCSTPPDFTCIQYPLCTDAEEALKNDEVF